MSTVIENYCDPNYEPSAAEVEDYAKWLGLSLPEDQELLYIAREGLKAPLPENWKACRSEKGEVYYFNFKTGQSIWDHPLDEMFKQRAAKEKLKHKSSRAVAARAATPAPHSEAAPINAALENGSANVDDRGEKRLNSKKNLKLGEVLMPTRHGPPALNLTNEKEEERNSDEAEGGEGAADTVVPSKSRLVAAIKGLKGDAPGASDTALGMDRASSVAPQPTVMAAAASSSQKRKGLVDGAGGFQPLLKPAATTGSLIKPALKTESPPAVSASSLAASFPQDAAAVSGGSISPFEEPWPTAASAGEKAVLKAAKEQVRRSFTASVESERLKLQKDFEMTLEVEKEQLLQRRMAALEAERARLQQSHDNAIEEERRKLDFAHRKAIEAVEQQQAAELSAAQADAQRYLKHRRETMLQQIRALEAAHLYRMESTHRGFLTSRQEFEERNIYNNFSVKIGATEDAQQVERKGAGEFVAEATKVLEMVWQSGLHEMRKLALDATEQTHRLAVENAAEATWYSLQESTMSALMDLKKSTSLEEARSTWKQQLLDERRRCACDWGNLFRAECNILVSEVEQERSRFLHSLSQQLGIEEATARIYENKRKLAEELRVLQELHRSEVEAEHARFAQQLEDGRRRVAEAVCLKEHAMNTNHVAKSAFQEGCDVAEIAAIPVAPEVDSDPLFDDLADSLKNAPWVFSNDALKGLVAATLREVLEAHENGATGAPRAGVVKVSTEETAPSRGQGLPPSGGGAAAAVTKTHEHHELLLRERQRLAESKQQLLQQRAELEERKKLHRHARKSWKRDVFAAKREGVSALSNKGQWLRRMQLLLEEQASGFRDEETVLAECEKWILAKESRTSKFQAELEQLERSPAATDYSTASMETAALVADFFTPEKVPPPPPLRTTSTRASDFAGLTAPPSAGTDGGTVDAAVLTDTLHRIEKQLGRLTKRASLLPSSATGLLPPSYKRDVLKEHFNDAAVTSKGSGGRHRRLSSSTKRRHVDFAAM